LNTTYQEIGDDIQTCQWKHLLDVRQGKRLPLPENRFSAVNESINEGKPMNDKTMMTAVCGKCVAWQPVELKGPRTIGEPRRGFCMMMPPQVALIVRNGQEVGQKNMRPATMESEFCMSFVPAPEKTNAANE
jgi:hypothetical protein